jgi:hypothetical protein
LEGELLLLPRSRPPLGKPTGNSVAYVEKDGKIILLEDGLEAVRDHRKAFRFLARFRCKMGLEYF